MPPSSPTPYSRLQVHDNRLVSQSSTGSSESSLSHMTEEKPVLPGVTVRAATKENLVQLVIQSLGWCMVWEIECQFKRAEWPWQLLDHLNLLKRESSELNAVGKHSYFRAYYVEFLLTILYFIAKQIILWTIKGRSNGSFVDHTAYQTFQTYSLQAVVFIPSSLILI